MYKAAFSLMFFAAAAFAGGMAQAATVSNDDTEERVITVTENGQRKEFTIPAGESVNLCATGCFITFPSGNMLALQGEEKVHIEGGDGRLISQ